MEVLQECSLERTLVGEIGARPCTDAGEHVDHEPSDVAHRQVADDPLLAELQHVDCCRGGEDDVVVREHHSLRIARRAGGVDEAAALVHVHVGEALVEVGVGVLSLLRGAQLHELLPTHHSGVGGLPRVLDDLLHRRYLIQHLK